MKKIKYLLFLIPFLLSFNVSAKEINVNSYVSATSGGTKNRYKATEIYETGMQNTYTIGTRYNGRISVLEFYLDYAFEEGYPVSIILNMATNDWRNNGFMGPQVFEVRNGSIDDSYNFAGGSSISYISRRKIKFSFTPKTNVSNVFVRVYSSNYLSTAMTGDSNWNLSSIVVDDSSYDSSSGGGSSGGSSSTNQDIINNQTNNTNNIISNNNQNTQDIIDNNNQNTQDIIDNQNKNQEQINQLLGQCFTNIYNFSHVNSLINFLNNNGVFVQQTADSFSTPSLKLQFYNNNTYVDASSYRPVISVGRFKFDFTKTSSFNNIRFGVNGSQIDTLIDYDVSYLKDNHDYSLIFEISNATQGSITLKNIMITDKVTYLLPYIAYNETTCNSKLDNVGQSIVNGAQSIIDNVNNGNQQINDNLDDIKDSLTDETTPEINLDLNLDTSSPVSDLLTMPITILNKVFDSTDDTCQPYILPFDFSGGNNTLTLPCIDLKDFLGNSVYNVLDTILCFYLCYQIGMMCISIYEDITSLHDSFDSLYTPKHGKPLGKHTREVY